MTVRLYKPSPRLFLLTLAATLLLGACSPPLTSNTRTCILCVETHTNDHSRITASSLSGTYTFSRNISFTLAYEEGQAFINETSLGAGCFVGEAREGDVLRFVSARNVHLEAPAPREACR